MQVEDDFFENLSSHAEIQHKKRERPVAAPKQKPQARKPQQQQVPAHQVIAAFNPRNITQLYKTPGTHQLEPSVSLFALISLIEPQIPG